MQGTLESFEEAELLQPHLKSSLTINIGIMERQRRCVLAYLMARAEKIQKMRWELGAILTPQLKEKLSVDVCKPNRQETEFFATYDKLLTNYARTMNFDSWAELDLPPKNLFIEIRVLQDGGTIQTETGTLTLQKGTQRLVRRSEVEHLIKLGIVEHVSTSH